MEMDIISESLPYVKCNPEFQFLELETLARAKFVKTSSGQSVVDFGT